MLARKKLAYDCAQMFALVADIESYPRFLDDWREVSILKTTDLGDGVSQMRVRQTVCLAGMEFSFKSIATLHPDSEIKIDAQDGPFKSLRFLWRFFPEQEHGCIVELTIDAALNTALQAAVAPVLQVLQQQLIARFADEARRRFGAAASD